MATASGLAYHIDRLRHSGTILALVALVIGLVLFVASVASVVLLQPVSEPILVAPLRWYS